MGSSPSENMKQPDDPMREADVLRERLSRLSKTSLRITEDLDLETVLQEVVSGARALTESKRGFLLTLDDAGGFTAYLTSGVTAEEYPMIIDLPGGIELYNHLTRMSEPLRVADFSAYLASLGLPGIDPPLGPIRGFLGTPIRHRGRNIGIVTMADRKDGGAFSPEDEDTLLMFASHAAMAIANAERHREEQRARADLETLVNMTPVGVVVLDARTGTTKSRNREARRIIDNLRRPDQSEEQLLQTLTYRRADGREILLRAAPLARVLSTGETVRAEEIVFSVPGGQSVTAIVSATPIQSGEGEVESVVVTLQDMTPLENMERLRAEFLATVSHELRVPLTSIKGSVATVLGSATDLDPAVVRQFFRIIEEQADHMHSLVADLLDVARIESGTLAVSPEPAEVVPLVDRARNGFANAGGRNNLVIEVEPGLPLVMADRWRVVQVLSNLLSNAARHSKESTAIRVAVVREDIYVAFSVADEGRGIPSEQLPHLFRKFLRIEPEDQEGDTGLGLAICKGIVEAHGGRIWAESEGPGLGARFTFTLPTAGEAASDVAGNLPSLSTRAPRRAVEERVRVLAVDDDPQDLLYVRDTLIKSGYAPIVTGDPGEALRLMDEERPGLVLLDLMLPDADGLELMKDILLMADVPVIFLSAYGQEELIVKAFDMGAVDYVVKPFSPSELAARIRAALRKLAVSEPSEPFVLGDLTIDYVDRAVTLAGRPVELRVIEYRLLTELSANGGRVVTYEQLLQRVWGNRGSDDLRPMRTVIKKLRRKLGDDAANPTYIFTEPRVGYRMPKGERPWPEAS
ncbi:MAG: response regulator [Caldilineaceae bacterium SB0666_bin_21]|nr:response regulator [Caldilineaceae bacterium SB0666_bin_21]